MDTTSILNYFRDLHRYIHSCIGIYTPYYTRKVTLVLDKCRCKNKWFRAACRDFGFTSRCIVVTKYLINLHRCYSFIGHPKVFREIITVTLTLLVSTISLFVLHIVHQSCKLLIYCYQQCELGLSLALIWSRSWSEVSVPEWNLSRVLSRREPDSRHKSLLIVKYLTQWLVLTTRYLM